MGKGMSPALQKIYKWGTGQAKREYEAQKAFEETLSAAQAPAFKELEKQKSEALAELNKRDADFREQQSAFDAAIAAAEKDLTERRNAQAALERDLENNVAGFLTGAIPKAQAGTKAGVNVRDPYAGVASPAPAAKKPAPEESKTPLIIAGLILAYFMFKKGRK